MKYTGKTHPFKKNKHKKICVHNFLKGVQKPVAYAGPFQRRSIKNKYFNDPLPTVNPNKPFL